MSSDVLVEEESLVKIAGPAQRESVKAVILLAFASDPVARWLHPKADDYLRWFSLFIDAFAGGALEHESAQYIPHSGAAALWLPPGVGPDERAVGAIEQSLPADRLRDMLGIFEQMGQAHPREPHWYLPMIGVEPVNQGRGCGALLMRSMCERLDREGQIAYLESSNSRNISLYERHGFEQRGIIQAGQSPQLVPMIRYPRS